MKFQGTIKEVDCNRMNRYHRITLSVDSNKYDISSLQNVHSLDEYKQMDIEIKEHKAKRSLDANACLWWCIGNISNALNADKWDIYLQMLKRYGKYTHIVVKENAVEAMKEQWRECEVVGEIDIHGTKAVQMLCYFGSSTYNSKEFATLLNGVISELEEMGLNKPIPADVQRMLKEYERLHE